MAGVTTPDGFRKIIIDAMEQLLAEYEKNRKDLFARVKKA
jgi:hypothetical protein